jgi:hypothetical protein
MFGGTCGPAHESHAGTGFIRWAVWGAQSFVNGGGRLDLPPVVTNFLDAQHAWVLNQIGQNPKSDYWQQANLVFGQVQRVCACLAQSVRAFTGTLAVQVMGVYDGYASVAPEAETLGYNDIWWMNIGNDISDLQTAFNVSGSSSCDAISMKPDYMCVWLQHLVRMLWIPTAPG